MPAMLMDHDVDPRQKLLEEMGDISKVEVFNNQILVAVYLRPEKTSQEYQESQHYLHQCPRNKSLSRQRRQRPFEEYQPHQGTE